MEMIPEVIMWYHGEKLSKTSAVKTFQISSSNKGPHINFCSQPDQ